VKATIVAGSARPAQTVGGLSQARPGSVPLTRTREAHERIKAGLAQEKAATTRSRGGARFTRGWRS